MKKAFRIISALMLVVMLVSVFAACNNESTPTTEPNTTGGGNKTSAPTAGPSTGGTVVPGTGSGTVNPPNTGKFDGLDFGGEEIGIIMSGGELATRSITKPEDDDETYSVNVAVKERNDRVQELLNVVIVPKETVAMQGMVSHMREYFGTPDTSYDIVGVYQYFDMGLAFGDDVGSFYNYNDIEEDEMFLDPTAPYWDTDCYNILSYDGASFWITGDLSQTWLSTIFVSYVNAEMWGDYEDEIEEITGFKGDIYELVYEGKWTIDLWIKLNELVHINRDGNDASVSPDDQHGFVGYNSESNINNIIVDGMFSGCHVTFSKIGSDGIPVMDYNNAALKAYVNATKTLYNESKSCTVVYNGDMTAMDIFASGNSLMTVNTLAEAELSLADMTADYYILPPPKANEAQKDYATTVGDGTNQFGIPKGCEDIGAATATLEALGYYSMEIVTPEYYDNALKGRYTRGDSEKAADMIDFVRSKIYNDFVLLWTGSMSESVSWYLRKNIGNNIIASEAPIKQATWGRQLGYLLEDIEDTGYIDM